MKLIDMIETLNMVLPYYDDPTDYVFGAEHDQIYLYATDRPLSPEHVNRMVELGWSQKGGANEDAPDAYAAYDPEESWYTFT